MRNSITRRSFLKATTATVVGAGACGWLFRDSVDHFLTESLRNRIDLFTASSGDSAEQDFTPLSPNKEIFIRPGDMPVYSGNADDSLPLIRYFSHLGYAENNPAKVQLINVFHNDFSKVSQSLHKRPVVHNSIFPYAGNKQRYIIPWAPLCPKQTPVRQLHHELFASLGNTTIFIKDEGSDSVALFGNKARKYEFGLPFCLQTGAKQLVLFGSLASNHCLYTTLAASCSGIGARFNLPEPEVLINLYPQQFHNDIPHKLKYLLALGARIRFLDSDPEVAWSILVNEARERFSPDDDLAYFEPGGSNPLTTLSHINAIFELAEQIKDGVTPLKSPPDYIFVPLGSGGTSMGLVLGCYLLGWKTKVVGTTSQDKSAWKRTLLFGNPVQPFLVQNAERLLKNTLDLLGFLDIFPSGQPVHDAAEIFEKHFVWDNSIWPPGYGIPSARTAAIIEDFAARSGLVLDPTFSGKSFTTLLDYVLSGKLDSKQVLFWNTHQRFDFMACKKVQDIDLALLPQNLQQYLTKNMHA